MSDPKTPIDAILKFTKNMDDGLEPAKTLLDDLTSITAGHMKSAEDAGVDASAMAPLQDALDQVAAMQALIGEVQAAQSEGGWEKPEALSKRVADVTGMPSFEPDVYEPPYDTLMEAVEDDDLEAMTRVLEAEKPDLNVPLGENGMTPLLHVLHADQRSVEKVKLLIEHGARADASCDGGYSSLHAIGDYMWRHDDYDAATDEALAKLLVAHGADLEARDGYCLTPLLRAINCGTVSEVAALLAAGVDPNATSPEDALPACHANQTALMAAAAKPEEVQVLLDYGADINARSPEGLTVLEVIGEQLRNEVENDNYPEYYRKLRESQALIDAAARPV